MYSGLFITKWTESQVLKTSIIAFIISFFGTLALFFLVLALVSGFNIWWVLINLQWIPDVFAATGMLLIALFQMTSWMLILEVMHKRTFGVWFSLKPQNNQLSRTKLIVLSLLFGISLLFLGHVLDPIFDLIGITEVENKSMEVLIVSYPYLALLFFPVVGAFEEVFFRGMLQKTLSDKYNWFVGLGGASFIFTILHGTQYGVKTLVIVFMMSLLLGLVYLKYKNIYLNMITHYINNFVAVLIVLVSSGFFTGEIKTEYKQEKSTYNIFTKTFSQGEQETYPYVKYFYNGYIMKNCTTNEDQVTQVYLDLIDGKKTNCDLKQLKYDLEKVQKELSQVISADKGSNIQFLLDGVNSLLAKVN